MSTQRLTSLQVRPRRQVTKERPTRAKAEARRQLAPNPRHPDLALGGMGDSLDFSRPVFHILEPSFAHRD